MMQLCQLFSTLINFLIEEITNSKFELKRMLLELIVDELDGRNKIL